MSLQNDLERLHDGETLELSPGEFPGPVVIRRPVTIEGRGATIWALKGPVVSIESDRVTFRDLRIEVTGDENEVKTAEEGCAVLVRRGENIDLDKITVRGSVIGLKAEEGDWSYPLSLQLGRLKHGREHDFLLRMVAPVKCRLKSNISDLEITPQTLIAGSNEVRLHINRVAQDTLLSGEVTISTGFLVRRFTVTALIAPAQVGHTEAIEGNDQVVWQPADWEKQATKPPRQSVPITPDPIVITIPPKPEEGVLAHNPPTPAPESTRVDPPENVRLPSPPISSGFEPLPDHPPPSSLSPQGTRREGIIQTGGEINWDIFSPQPSQSEITASGDEADQSSPSGGDFLHEPKDKSRPPGISKILENPLFVQSQQSESTDESRSADPPSPGVSAEPQQSSRRKKTGTLSPLFTEPADGKDAEGDL